MPERPDHRAGGVKPPVGTSLDIKFTETALEKTQFHQWVWWAWDP